MRLLDLTEFIVDCPHSTAIDEGEGIALIRTPNIGAGFFILDNVHRVSKSVYEERIKRGKPQRNDLVYAREAPAGNVAIIKDEVLCLGQRTVLIRPDQKKVNPLYLMYYLLSDSKKNQLLSKAHGSTVSHVNMKDIRELNVDDMLPLDIQQKIASILSQYDVLIENNKKRIQLLEQMAKNLYKEWFVRFRFPGYKTAEFESGIPKGWTIKKLNNVADIVYGFPFNSSLFCSDSTLNPVVRIRDIVDKHTETFTSEKPDDKYLIHTNEILIGMDGIFHMNIWTNDGDYLNQRVVKVTSKEHNLSNLFLFYSIFPQVKMLESIISGTTVAHLSAKDMNKMTVLIPSDDILKLCFSKFENIMSMRRTLLVQNDLLTTQRDLLLPRLMSGKLSI